MPPVESKKEPEVVDLTDAASRTPAASVPAISFVPDEDEGADEGDDVDLANLSPDEESNPVTNSDQASKQKNKKKKSKALSKARKKLSAALVPNSSSSSSTSATTNTSVEREPNSTTIESDTLNPEVVERLRAEVAKQHGDKVASQIKMSQIADVIEKMKLKEVAKGNVGIGGKNKKDMADHKFWGTQPVPKLSEEIEADQEGPIEPCVPRSEVQQDPYPLPKDFEWCTLDLTKVNETQEVYELLTNHYVEDDDASFRFDYSSEFLSWALKPPGYFPSWHIGVRVSSTRRLVAFISGVPTDLRVRQKTIRCSEINFLCVHKKLRSKRLAPVLIKEVTRRCHLEGIFQAIYTAGVVLPTPFSTSRYYHRSLNPIKLVEIGFSSVPRSMTLARMVRLYSLPTATSTPGFREMEEKDVPAVGKLLRRFLTRFEMAPHLNDDECRHMFMSGRGVDEDGVRKGQVTWCYVVEDPNTHAITDFVSFYSLPSTVMRNPKHNSLKAAYAFLYASDVVFPPRSSTSNIEEEVDFLPSWHEESDVARSALKRRLKELFEDAMVVAKKADFDVFNALTIMDNNLFIPDLKFGAGDGYLNFYLYNWRIQSIEGGQALVAPQLSTTIGGSQKSIGNGAGKIEPGIKDGSGIGIVML
uniref:Glycylpeptide N-tetradecanoyltransferase n=1 Tax=Bartheletia paradoxa TaxID=669517 RepID=A0A2D0XHX9_9BASI|nr:hypothetical protein SPAR04175 [Bartheletia paradoxa]